MRWREAAAWWLVIFFARLHIWYWLERRYGRA